MEKRAITQPANALLPGRGFDAARLTAPGAAVDAFFARVRVPAPGVELVPIDEAAGRILARDIVAGEDYPSRARSAMDGFACRAGDTPGLLALDDAVAMGAPPAPLRRGCAAPIPTGGLLPDGADAVIPIEDAHVRGNAVRFSKVVAGENVIAAGADMRAGETVLYAGTRIRAPHAGALAALGIADVPVYRRPLVGVLSSGDELVDVATAAPPGAVRDSNRYAIAASLRAMGARVRHFPRFGDDPGECEAALERALGNCDAVVVSGGSSVGARDRIPAAVAALGAPGTIVHGLKIKPGKPALLGALGVRPILGLPGNPASALLVLEGVFAPIVGALTGAAAIEPSQITATLAEPIPARPEWTRFLPVALVHEDGAVVAHPLSLRSFSVSLAARAAGYLVVGDDAPALPAGASVCVRRFLGG